MYNDKQVTNSSLKITPSFYVHLWIKQLTRDILWDEVVLMNQFQFRFCGDMKDLLLTMHNPMTLSQAIAQTMCCDNQLFECWQEKH